MATLPSAYDGNSSTVPQLARLALVPGWLLLALTALPFAAALPVSGRLAVPLSIQVVPLLASILVLGLPHGAVDHLAIPRVRGAAPTPGDLRFVGSLYLVLGSLYAVLWFVAPVLAFVGFIALTWVHWGQGDLHALVDFADADHLPDHGSRALAVVVRGGMPMLVPLLAFPDWYRRVAIALAGLFGSESVASIDWLFRLDTRLALGAAFGLVVAGYLALGYGRADGTRSAWAVDVVETVGLACYFLLVPPLLAIGVYFAVWPSLRHIVRLIGLDDASVEAIRSDRPRTAVRRFVIDATPLTLGALAFMAGFYVLVPADPGTPLELVALYLLLLSVLTLPHVVVVSVVDRAQSIW